LTRKIFKLATGHEIFDTQTGLRGIPNKYLKDIVNIKGDRYEYEINMLISFAIKKINIVEVDISTVYIDDNKTSNFNAITDSYRIYKCIIFNTNLGTIILFSLSAFTSFLIDYFVLINMVYLFWGHYNYDIAILYSAIIARGISSIFNFLTNYFIVFKSKEKICISAFKYYVLALFVLCINYVLLDILVVKFNLNLKISKIVVEVVLFLLNYIIEKVIFKKDLTSSVYGKK